MSKPVHIISLGAGVQSSTMALMAKHGEITPMPIGAIFADTQDEPASVYKWLDWLEKQLPFPVHRVTIGKLSERALKLRTAKTGGLYCKTDLPIYTLAPDGALGKKVGRQCTHDFKVAPLMKEGKRLAGLAPLSRCKDVRLIQWIGISLDEIVRMKTAREKWAESRWPLVELRMRRDDCLRWMKKHGYPEPPRSACVYCPFHSNTEWRRLKTEEPEEFIKAVDFEKALQSAKAQSKNFRAVPFLHRSCVPLGEIDFSTDVERGQGAWWEENFRDECEGMCGV